MNRILNTFFVDMNRRLSTWSCVLVSATWVVLNQSCKSCQLNNILNDIGNLALLLSHTDKNLALHKVHGFFSFLVSWQLWLLHTNDISITVCGGTTTAFLLVLSPPLTLCNTTSFSVTSWTTITDDIFI
jgi:hypothetical protein